MGELVPLKRKQPALITDPGPDPPLFPRGWLLVPWGIWVLVVPLIVATAAPFYADHVRDRERAERTAREAEQRAKWAAREAERRRVREALTRGKACYEQGAYPEAVEQLSLYLQKHPLDTQALWYRGLAHLEQGELRRAVDDFDALLARDSSQANALRSRGQARALLGDRQGAIEDHQRAFRFSQDPYAAIWVAGLGGDDVLLRRFASGRRWIDEVARFVLGQTSAEQLLQIAGRNPDEKSRREQLCEAYGYIGLVAERDGRLDEARQAYHRCVQTGVRNFIEYRWALIRLQQDDASQPERD